MSSACVKSRQRGVALISVLLVFALAALLAMQLQRASNADIRQLDASIATSQARWYTRGGEALGRQLLAADKKADIRSNDISDALTDDWAKALDFPLDEGEILIKINDMSGYINLNTLDWSSQGLVVGSIFAQLGLPPNAVTALQAYYLQPAANGSKRQLVHLEQLQSVAGLTLEQCQALGAYFSVLPRLQNTTSNAVININTIDERLMRLLGWPRGEISDISRRQKYKKYRTADLPLGSFIGAMSSNIGVYSEYFEILGSSSHAGRRAYLRSVVYRDGAGKTQVLQRTTSKQAVMALLNQRGGL